MMRKILTMLILTLGLAAGLAAGYGLRQFGAAAEADRADTPPDYIKLANQFIIPVVEGGRVTAMVVMSLSLEMPPGSDDLVFAREPKLRDALLQVLFSHANAGGFHGAFTEAASLTPLRKALTEQAVNVLGPGVSDVLITEIARQDH